MNEQTQQADTTAPVPGTISNRYRFGSYDPKTPIASEEFRVAKCLYKGKKDRATGKLVEAEHANSCVLVPFLAAEAVQEKLVELMPHILQHLESVQDEIIKDIHRDGSEEVAASSISIAGILGKLEASATSARVNGETIGIWFDESIADVLAVAFADKMGVSDVPSDAESDRINSVVAVYRSKMMKLASGKTFYVESEAEKLRKCLEVSGAVETSLGQKFDARLARMIEDGQKLEDSFLDL